MAQLRQDYPKFVKRDTEVIVVGPDSKSDFKKFWKEKEIPFTGLADPEHEVAKQYQQEVSLIKFGRMPAQMIIDKNGIVQYVHYSTSMADIPENEAILEILNEVNL